MWRKFDIDITVRRTSALSTFNTTLGLFFNISNYDDVLKYTMQTVVYINDNGISATNGAKPAWLKAEASP